MNGICAVLAAGFAALVLRAPPASGQGSLTPPGPPAPAMRTLEEVEPRRPISSLPYIISQPGSYYLTTNLVAGVPAGGITVGADSVSLDLCGFALVGSPLSLHTAIAAAETVTGLHVHNGWIRNWRGRGIFAPGANGHLEDLVVVGAGGDGMYLGDNWTVIGCTAVSNGYEVGGGAGIRVGNQSTIRDCVARTNAGYGFSAEQGCVIAGCTASLNMVGIFATTGCRVRDCSATRNTAAGIVVYWGGSVIGCVASTNGEYGVVGVVGCQVQACAVCGNGGDGINVADFSEVRNCAAYLNQGDAIEITSYGVADGNNCTHNAGTGIKATAVGNRIQGNQVADNTAGGIDCARTNNNNLVVRNSAHGNGGFLNYNFPPGTRNARALLTPLQDFITDQPWANFDY